MLSRALLRSQPDLIVARLSCISSHTNPSNVAAVSAAVRTIAELAPTIDPATASSSMSENIQVLSSTENHEGRARFRRSKRREQLVVRYRVPALFVNKAWEIEFFKSRAGWTCSLRTCNMVPQDSLAFHMVKIGDERGLQELFDQGHASPFDVTEYTNNQGMDLHRKSLLQVRYSEHDLSRNCRCYCAYLKVR